MTRHYAFLLSSRHRAVLPWGVQPDLTAETKDPEVIMLRSLLLDLKASHGDNLIVVGLGGDCNFGLRVRLLCLQHQIGFAEYMVLFNEYIPKAFFEEFFFGRHGAILDLVDGASATTTAVFHIFLGKSRYTHIEDLIVRVRQSITPYHLYAEDNRIIETNQATKQQLATV